MYDNKKVITADQAIDLITKDEPLVNYIINEDLDLHKIQSAFKHKLIFENCVIESLTCPSTEFSHPVVWKNTHFIKTSCFGAWFLQGLVLDGCTFDSYLDLEAGGHNQKPIIINNCEFKEFVNFSDCWFQHEIIVTNNHFHKGSNLQGNRALSDKVSFDVPPVIENNIGRIDQDWGDDGQSNIANTQRPPSTFN